MANKNLYVVGGAVALVGGFILYRNSSAIQELVDSMPIGGGGGSAPVDLSFLGDLFANLPQNVSSFSERIVEGAVEIANKPVELFEAGKDSITDGIDDIKENIDSAVEGVKDGVANVINAPKKLLDKATNKVKDSIPRTESGIDFGKASAATLAGYGVAAATTGGAAPFLPFVAGAVGFIFGGTKLRDLTIDKTGNTPEGIVKDFFVDIWNGAKGLIGGEDFQTQTILGKIKPAGISNQIGTPDIKAFSRPNIKGMFAGATRNGVLQRQSIKIGQRGGFDLVKLQGSTVGIKVKAAARDAAGMTNFDRLIRRNRAAAGA